ncbi:MAG: nucleotide-binding protein [marine bacterium B5-7]|nr:MAG: nucleotide-binding protein [marine bacterium B5-7]
MHLIIISGRSGAGKSAALHMLEDLGFHCIDGLPAGLLPSLVSHLNPHYPKVAISLDTRNVPADVTELPQIIQQLRDIAKRCELFFLKADDSVLVKRFSQTRRRHPLSSDMTSLTEAIMREESILHPIMKLADITIDTNRLSVHELRKMIREHVDAQAKPHSTLLFQSFGFKFGVPLECDYVFDVRCLPNPYWEPALRKYTGLDAPVQTFLSAQTDTGLMLKSITDFLEVWLPKFEATNHAYMSIAIGCTGGQHRSVYITEQLGKHFSTAYQHLQLRHRELNEVTD